MLVLWIAAGVALGQFLFTFLVTLAEPLVARANARYAPSPPRPADDPLAIEGVLHAAGGTGAILNVALRNKYAIN